MHTYIFFPPPLLPQTPFSSGCHILEKRCEERREGDERGGHLTLCSADSPLSDGRTVKEGVTSLLRLTREGEERIEESFAVSFPRYCQNHYKFRKEMGIPDSETPKQLSTAAFLTISTRLQRGRTLSSSLRVPHLPLKASVYPVPR